MLILSGKLAREGAMNVRRIAWRIWIALTTIWIVLLLLTGKYGCPLFFWESHLQCTMESTFRELISLSGVPLMMLGAGTFVGWIVGVIRIRISRLEN
jgi:hypothetical protein